HGGDANLALSLAQTARRGMPKAGATADTLAWASYHVGAYDTARKLLEDAAAQQPGNATYQYHLGLTYLKMNETVRGKAALQMAIGAHRLSFTAKEDGSAGIGLRKVCTRGDIDSFAGIRRFSFYLLGGAPLLAVSDHPKDAIDIDAQLFHGIPQVCPKRLTT